MGHLGGIWLGTLSTGGVYHWATGAGMTSGDREETEANVASCRLPRVLIAGSFAAETRAEERIEPDGNWE